MNKMPDTYTVAGETRTWDEWSEISGEEVHKLKNRWRNNNAGNSNHTPLQVVGLEETNWRKAKNDRVRRNKKRSELPKGAQAMLDGSHYKIGLHGFVYMLVDGDWVRSERDACEVRAMM